ncbi:hypothetical protein KKI23_01245 [Patescibacteria group bacterium]|nr:hypothetical protein [Patescibacteria group bacterium]
MNECYTLANWYIFVNPAPYLVQGQEKEYNKQVIINIKKMDLENNNQQSNQEQKPEKGHPGGLKKAVLVISIVIVLNLFIGYGITTFWHSPDYEDYCTDEINSKAYSDQTTCEAAGGKWMPGGEVRAPDELTKPSNYCQADYSCQKEYQATSDLYNRNFFLIEVVAGIILIVVGLFSIKAQSVSLGLSYGGLLALLVGMTRYWSGMQEYLRFIILGLALVVLIWVGVKKFRE